MKKRSGFTLIELLVVIAIIALLLAMLMPSLKKAKEIATAVVCMNNQKTMAMAYKMYSEDHDDRAMVGLFGEDGGWVADRNGDYTLANRIATIKTGTLFPYVGAYKAYHCPGDRRWRQGTIQAGQRWTEDSHKIYVSYTVPDIIENANGDKKFTNIANPAESYLFVEDGYDGRGANNYSWDFGPTTCGVRLDRPDMWAWHDPMGMFHTDGCTLSFVDGHAEKYTWRDRRSQIFFADRLDPEHPDIRRHSPQPYNEDIRYMLRHLPRFR